MNVQVGRVQDEDVFVFYADTDISSIPRDITSLRIDSSVRVIPADAFFNQRQLKKVEYEEGLRVIGDRAFYGCEELQEQRFPSTLVEIGELAFWGCRCLKSVGDLPPSLKIIRKLAFHDCRKLKRFEMHEGILLEESVFSGCKSLSYVRLPHGMVTIPEGLFERCISLTHFWIPPTVEHVGRNAFANCKSLLSAAEVPEGNYEELVAKLKSRFDGLPLHHICYNFQSDHSLDETISKFQSILQSDPSACERVDFLRMTPLHILALSLQVQVELFQELVSGSPVDAIMNPDAFGLSPFDYLIHNHYSAAAVVEMLKPLLRSFLESQVSFLGLNCWREEILPQLDMLAPTEDKASLASQLSLIAQNHRLLMRKEILSLLDMSAWRKKMEEDQATLNDDSREICRITCGSTIIVNRVLPFLLPNVDEIVLQPDDEIVLADH